MTANTTTQPTSGDPQMDAAAPALGPDSSRFRAGVVLLVADGHLAKIVKHTFTKTFPDLTIICEPPETKAAIIKRRARILGWPSALGQIAAGILIRFVAKASRDRIDEICAAHGLPVSQDNLRLDDVPIHKVGSVNDPETVELINALQPDVVAVYGTRILKPKTLAALSIPVINYHAGITPAYRGQHPGYWALANRDPENAGVTVHLVDAGVDTGRIIAQATAPLSAKEDNIATYQFVQMTVGLPLFVAAIKRAQAKQPMPTVAAPDTQPTSSTTGAARSKIWYPPTLLQYLYNGVTARVW